jgi:predicted porin
MRKSAILLVPLFWGASAFGQSSVTLYGVIDSGLTFTSNQAGHSNLFFQGGIMSSTGFGFKGTEELGGGSRAIFNLRNTFNSGTGALQNGGIFGKEAWVGINNDRLGTLTFGNQMDFMFRYLTLERWGPMIHANPPNYLQQGPFAKLNLPNGALDFDRTADVYLNNNSVVYESRNFSGFKFGAMYAFGGQAGHFGQGSTQSYGLNYGNGTVQLDAAYTYTKFPNINNGNDGIQTWGVGARTAIYTGFIDAMYSNTVNTSTGGRVNVYQIGGYYPFTPIDAVSVNYQFDQGNEALNKNKAQQAGITVVHDLSKRTDIYAFAIRQWASGGADALAAIGGAGGISSGSTQTLLRIGITSRF